MTLRAYLIPLLFLSAVTTHSPAANLYWGGDVNNSFQTLGNWWTTIGRTTAATAIPGSSDIAFFNANTPLTHQIATLGANTSLAGLRFNGNSSTAITLGTLNDYTLTLGTSGLTIDSGAAAHTLNSSLSINTTQTWDNQSNSLFTVAGNLTFGTATTRTMTLSGTGGFAFTGNITSSNTRTLNITTTGPVTFGNIATTHNTSAYILTLNVAEGLNPEVKGVISGVGGITKDGLGTLTLSGANSFTNNFRILAGEVILKNSNTASGQTVFGNSGAAAGSNGFGTLTLDNTAAAINYRTTNVYVQTSSDGAMITSTGDAFAATMSLNGSRNFVINDSESEIDLLVTIGIINGDSTGTLTKLSIGTLMMQGANTYTGATNIDRGKLILDYSLKNGDNKLSNSAATGLRGGHLELRSHSTNATSETTHSLAISSGSNILSLVSNGGQDLTFTLTNGITRTGGALDIRSNDTSKTHLIVGGGVTNNSAGFLGGWATINGTRWATRNGNEIVALAGTTQNDKSLWATGENIILNGTPTGTLVTPSIASLILDDPAGGTFTIDNNAQALTLTSSAILLSKNVTADTTIEGGQILTQNSATNATNDLIITNHSTAKLDISANIGGSNTPLTATQNITVVGSGLTELSGSNTYSGSLLIQGNVQVSGGNAINDFRNTVLATGDNMTSSGARLNLNGSKEGIGNLSGGNESIDSNQTTGPGEVSLGNNGHLILNQTLDTEFRGNFTGTGTITKRGNRTLTLSTNAHSFSGNLDIEGGSIIALESGTAFSEISQLRLRGGSFTSIQSNSTSENKLGDATAVLLEGTTRDGLSVSSIVNGSRAETAGTLSLAGGANTITLSNTMEVTSSTAATTSLIFGASSASFSRSNGSTLLVRGNNLAGTAVANSVALASRLTFTTPAAINDALIGASTSALQTSSVTTLKILPYGIGENSVTGVGSSFLTYATTLGLRPLSETEYATDYGTAGATTNLSLNASALNLTEKTFNALRIVNNAGTSPLAFTGTGTLTLTSGALLFTAGATENDATLGGFSQILAGTSAGTADELVVFVTSSLASPASATLTVNSAIADNGGATSLTKSGGGTLVLGGSNTYTGTTTINEGVLEFGQTTGTLGSGSLRLSGGTLRWAAGNTTDITASSRTVQLLGSSVYLTPAAASVTSVGGSITSAGSTFDVGSNNVTLAGPVGGNGPGGLTKVGTGTLTLSSAPTYTGTTLITQGAMNFQTIAPDTMEGLYLASRGVGGTISSTITSGLNVQQLVVAGAYGNLGDTTGVTATLTVSGGAVNIGNGEGDDFILIGYRDTSSGKSTSNTTGTVNFSNASSVNINVSSIELGSYYGLVPDATRTSAGILTLSNALNDITAGKIIVGHSPISVNNTGSPSSINLGTGITTINTDTFVIGGARASGNVTIGNGGSFTLRGQQGGSTAANLFIGDNDSTTNTGTNNVSTLNLTGASTVDMKLNLLLLGRVSVVNSTGTNGYGRGTLTVGTGLIEATTIRMADPNYSSGTNNNVNTQGTITQSGTSTIRFMDLSKGNGTATWNWQGGTLQNIAGANQTNQNVTISLNGSGSATNPALRAYTVDTGRTATFQTDALFTGTGSFTKEGTGTLALHGTNVNTGTVRLTEGTLALHGTGTMDDAAWFNLATDTTLDFTPRTASSYTSDAVISGTGTLKVTGGTLTVGSNIGSVNSNGTLRPGASSLNATAASANTVGDLTGTLNIAGNLVLSGNTTRLDRATLQAGATTRNAASSLSGSDLATWVNNIPTAHSTFMTGAATGHDLISVTDGLTLNANGGITIIAADNYTGNFGDVFNFLDWSTLLGLTNNSFNVGPRYQTGLETNQDLKLFQLSSGLGWDTSLFLSHGVLVVVPEPSRALLLLLALLSLTLHRRRKN
ncbi:putative secreted protein with PEP-CTERM sorting signal [Prosthecobacter fusiformis]|uniref:Putative secreted protein with PEP-CTERM sorting signal n=1 Tax=Prosthecobacter fusiformis TaxID=48464 RepID=A0A4R7S6V7_9BACT|nr:autotransporter-associated beta strand repeat-containing protein [Prosthecobacter fusiformis]TDU73308.1 putative secreted protein with PEP-CTERM sorting signal [Prosthecobacter fusiformis]